MAKVLVVDDDDGIRQVLQEVLEEDQHEVETACDGQEALDVLRRSHGWIILLDMMMPRMDGMAVLRAIRSDPALRRGNVVVVMSAGELLRARGRALQQESADIVNGLLPKPFEFDEVLDLIARLSAA